MTLSADIVSRVSQAPLDRQRTVALLLDVANDPRFALRAEELHDLAAAVRVGGAEAAAWRGIDLHAAFAAGTTLRLRPRRRRRVAGLVAVLATVLLVLPCWRMAESFGEAAAAYQQFLDADATQGAGLIQLWLTGFGGTLAPGDWLPSVVQGAATLVVLSVALFLGAKLLSWSADRADRADHDRSAARLARAMTAASTVLNVRTVQSPAEGVEVLAEATSELLRAQQAAQQSLHVLQSATQRLDDSAALVANGMNAVGKSLGLHTGALQHQISELTQVRASLERISGLADDEISPQTNP